MTVIAYRKGILAGDSCWSEEGGLIVNVQNKLVRLPSGAIYGGAGAPDDRALLRLLANVREPSQLPPLRDLQGAEFDQLEALLVLPDKSVWIIETGPNGTGICPVATPWVAIGAGRAVAYGALAANLSAEEAVRIACDWNTMCRRPVHTLALRESTNGKRKQTVRADRDTEDRHNRDDGSASDVGAEGAEGA